VEGKKGAEKVGEPERPGGWRAKAKGTQTGVQGQKKKKKGVKNGDEKKHFEQSMGQGRREAQGCKWGNKSEGLIPYQKPYVNARKEGATNPAQRTERLITHN